MGRDSLFGVSLVGCGNPSGEALTWNSRPSFWVGMSQNVAMPCPTTNPQSDIKVIFAKRLKTWRKSRRLPLKKIAADLGITVSTLCQWENRVYFPSSDNFNLLVLYTKLPPCHFLCPDSLLAQCPEELK